MKRKIITPKQKATVALTALKGLQSPGQIASTFKVHPTQIKKWKTQAEENLDKLFTDKRTKEGQELEKLIQYLYQVIGQRDIEIDWLKKKLHLDTPTETFSD